MSKGFIIGKKVGMTQIFHGKEGKIVPVTVIEAGPCKVVDLINEEKRGYKAVKIAYGEIKEKKLNKPKKVFFEKKNMTPKAVLKEFRVENLEGYKEGIDITVSVFKEGEKVIASSKSKGKGFQGTIKRWNFSRGPMTHGSKNHRIPGAIGEHTFPAEVRKGKKMAGQLGNEKVSIKNLLVAKIDTAKNLIMLKGAVPGGKNNLVTIRSLS